MTFSTSTRLLVATASRMRMQSVNSSPEKHGPTIREAIRASRLSSVEFHRERAEPLRYHRRILKGGVSRLMTEPLVRFRGVNKSFGRAKVLSGVDFDIPAGKCTGLAGLNGAGK